MTNILHESQQEQATGNGVASPEPALTAQSLLISVTAISINLLGSVSFKVQHSADAEIWFDVPNLATGAITATGKTTISLNPSFSTLDYQRIVWTFNSANTITFAAYLTGIK